MKHGGLLGFLSEAAEIQEQLGCTVDEAFEVQRQLEAERSALEEAQAQSNVIPFRQKH